jgi:hypothetical protein
MRRRLGLVWSFRVTWRCGFVTDNGRAGDIYEIVGCGAEELQTKAGFKPETIDTIITVQCLCSIPTPQVIIKELYPLLKSGGQWLVFEHIKTPYQGDFVGYWQSRTLNPAAHCLVLIDCCRGSQYCLAALFQRVQCYTSN